MNVFAALGVLGLLIFIHEGGHFLAATLQGIRVSGFSLGFGPALIKKEFQEVTYALRVLPLGGFVSFPDDDVDSTIPSNDPDLLRNRPIAQRAFVISAGVLANLALAWLILLGQATFVGLPHQPEQGVLVVAVQPQEAAYTAGLTAGDQILSLNDTELGRGQEAVKYLVEKIKGAPGETLEMTTISSGKLSKIKITPSKKQGSGLVGAQLQPNLDASLRPAIDTFEAINQTNAQFLDLLNQTINGYKGLITNFSSTAKQLSGPVKIVEMGAQLTDQGITGLILFASLISINLAVLNALPLPLLDGGQLLLLSLEAVRGKPIPDRIQLAFMQSGFLLLVGLSVVLMIRDTTQLTIVQNLIAH